MYFHYEREIPYTRLQMYLNIIARLDILLCIRVGGTGEGGMGTGPLPIFTNTYNKKRNKKKLSKGPSLYYVRT